MNKKSITGNNSNAILISLSRQEDEEEVEEEDKLRFDIDKQPIGTVAFTTSIHTSNNADSCDSNAAAANIAGIISDNNKSLSKKLIKAFFKLRGVMYGLLAAFTLSLSKTVIKKAPLLIGSDHSLIRYILQFGLLFAVVKYKGLNLLGPSNKPTLRKLLTLRGILGAVGMVFLHFAITLIAPSDTVAIAHCSVIITSILARMYDNLHLNTFIGL